MAVETLPEPTIPITTPFRPGLGFLTATPIIAAATICLALVIASAILAPWLSPHDPLLLAPAQARERAIPARHRRLRPRCAVANSLWRPDLAADRPGRCDVQHRRRARDRPVFRLLQMARRRDHADHGRADGDPEYPARDRRSLAVGRQPDDRPRRHHHSAKP